MKRCKNLLLMLVMLAALPLSIALAAGLYFARLLINPPRAKQRRTPEDEGWAYQDAYFESPDGVPI